ncbi:hypothetical protein GYMLUDRAFT_157055, partial [Collybiopsis luxurians FD-317 M1]
IHRTFTETNLAQQAYKECKATGVLEALKMPLKDQRKEWFVVVVGEKPGVYCRLGVVKNGLGYHGGKICHVDGSYQDAEALYKSYKDQGKVKKLKSWHIA